MFNYHLASDFDTGSAAAKRAIALFLAALAASLLLYWPTLTAYFVSDELSILAHTHPRLGREWSDCLRLMTNGFWRPVNLLLFRAHIALFGLNPLPYHLTCLIIHSACAMLTGLLAGRLARGVVWAPVMACLLMASMPAAFGSATQLNQTNDSLLACCILGALLLWDDWLDRPRRRELFGLMGVIIFSVAVKETAQVIMPLLFLWALGRGRLDKRSVALVAGIGLFYAVQAVVILYFQSRIGGSYSSHGQIVRHADQFFIHWLDYIYSAFFPFPDLFQSDESRRVMTLVRVSRLKAGLVFVMMILSLVFCVRGSFRRVAALGLMIPVVLLPPSLLNVELRSWYLYSALPLVSLFAVGLAGAPRWWGRWPVLALVAAWWFVMVSWFAESHMMREYVEGADYYRRFAAAEEPHTHEWRESDVIFILDAPDRYAPTDSKWVYIQLLHQLHNFGECMHIGFDGLADNTDRLYWFDGEKLVEIPSDKWSRFFTIWSAM